MKIVIFEIFLSFRNKDGKIACPECLPFVGKIYRKGVGPQPPLHPNCNCFRMFHHWMWEEEREVGNGRT